MCGRFSLTKKTNEIKNRFNVTLVPKGVGIAFNIAPDHNIAIILNESPQEVSLARWGLVPSWSKEEKTKYSMINARAETLQEKPSYKRLLDKRRCLVLADSFYEWQKLPDEKVPHRIYLKDEEMFAFAGLWDLWEHDGNALISCTIVTTSPNQICSRIHDRMPVILPKEQEWSWLNDPTDKALNLLQPYAGEMDSYPISKEVNNPSNNSAEIINRYV